MKPSTREQLEIALAAPRPIPTDREELEVERLIPSDCRRVTVDMHDQWKKSLSAHGFDEDFDDLIEVPWPEVNAPSRRKDSEINRVLLILDNLQTRKELA